MQRRNEMVLLAAPERRGPGVREVFKNVIHWTIPAIKNLLTAVAKLNSTMCSLQPSFYDQ